MPDRDRQLDQAEAAFSDDVAAALAATAEEFAAGVGRATELVAARFSVGSIGRMWRARVPGLVRRLLGIGEDAAQAAAEDTGTPLPDGWDDLPGRYDDDRLLPHGMGQYAQSTERLLNAVGERLTEAARRELAAGLDAGEDVEQLRARLVAAFSREGAQLGPGREARITQTEAARAWNTATIAAARALTGPTRPLVKQWITRGDSSVRRAHARVNGQLRLLAEPFMVGGVPMDTPGDPSAPPGLTVNCRCRLAVAAAPRRNRTAAYETQASLGPEFSDPRERRVDASPSVTAASTEHTGAMIALVPRAEDAARLALTIPDAEPAGELHLTLYYLGEGADWSDHERADLIAGLQEQAQQHGLADGPVHGRAFGANHWNADRSPCWVWAVGDDHDRPADTPTLESARQAATYALEERHGPEIPSQYTPWQPHVAATYSDDPDLLADLNDRLGPVVFDRIRVAFAGEYTDIPLGPAQEAPAMATASTPIHAMPRPWSTPGDTALAYEDTETGDGRVFRPGALYWDGPGPWPLQYADEMLGGHDGAQLAGAIQSVDRAGPRITGQGVLYPGLPAGADALMILEQNGPLGVSVDLDAVNVEFIDRSPEAAEGGDEEGPILLLASLPAASLMRLSDGSWCLTATTRPEWTASGIAMSRTAASVQLITGPGGIVPAAAVRAAFGPTGILIAAVGDPDNPDDGVVVHRESSGDFLMRVTSARLRGATLVSMPAYDQARIVLDPIDGAEDDPEATEDMQAAATPGEAQQRVIAYVTGAPVPIGAREIAAALGISMEAARRHLADAAQSGHLTRLARGLYIGPTVEGPDALTAAVSGNIELPIHPERDRAWDGDQAGSNVLAWATGEDGEVDADRLGSAFLYRDADADPATLSAYKLGFADVVDGELHIIPAGVFAVAGVLQGSMGGVDLPEDDREPIMERVEQLYARIAETFDEPDLHAPWDDEDQAAGLAELEASAWSAMRDTAPLPAAWFREPTPEELPPGSGGVHYRAGRIYGWVAQAGEPHAGMPGRRVTIDSLGRIDMTHFLRARFTLDDGTVVKAGAFTMNVGHHRDGAECETASCQFDDTRTVAGIVTVGMNARGMWFSGAAAPWLSEWDRQVFQACQPSYHMRQGPGGRWQLRAVLSVPVPGHSSPLVATAVCDRSNLAIAASAGTLDMLSALHEDTPGHGADTGEDTGEDTPEGRGTDTALSAAADLRGHREDTLAGTGQDRGGHLALLRSADVDAVASALLTSVPFLDVLLTALDRHQLQRDARRAEVAALAASVHATTAEGKN
ncbi:phage minor head protein [Streptomyces sp. NPDC057250]|uniref:phage minor head protein n=1 Tax=Streptomyces sp. NPDC057250 TaxID=3346068 RepID=UPI0036413B78